MKNVQTLWSSHENGLLDPKSEEKSEHPEKKKIAEASVGPFTLNITTLH